MPSVLTVHSLWEGVKAVGLLGVGEGHSHARRERGVEDDGSALIAGRQVHRGHGANALAVHDHILWPDTIPARTQSIFAIQKYWCKFCVLTQTLAGVQLRL